MQETVLNVMGEEEVLNAVRRVWVSGDSAEAQAYRTRVGLKGSAMAVLVQLQVSARVAGVAFARDPISGEEIIVVEAVAGLGEALVSGKAEPQRWRIASPRSNDFSRSNEGETAGVVTTSRRAQTPRQAPLLSEREVSQVVTLVERACELFGEPQDVEWACDDEKVWMLQSRPITTLQKDWFTDYLPNDHNLWTAAFLNERFTQPVSPLGWSMIAKPLERLALRGPLELLGAQQIEGPLLKLWRGHPYSRVEAWQRIYKLFPDGVLPEDAERYFPEGDTSLRHAPRQPTFGFHLFWNGVRLLKENFAAVSPLHNPQAWKRYEQRQVAHLIRFRFAERQLARDPNPIRAGRALLQDVADLTDELLELHRWSLLYADLTYSLLRRLLIMRYGASEGATRAVQLTAGVSSPTTRMNRALGLLAVQVAKNKQIREYLITLSAQSPDFSKKRLNHDAPQIEAFLGDLQRFIEKYGHRFFSLDFYDAPWEADIAAFARFLLTLSQGTINQDERKGSPLQAQVTSSLLGWAVRLTRAYLRLREAQRFHWQQLLALQRRVVLVMGKWWAEHHQLVAAEDVFGLTWDELMSAQPDAKRAAARMKQLSRLRKEAKQAPGWHYPDFLRGNEPLRPIFTADTLGLEEGLKSQRQAVQLKGRPVSPGIAQGPARLITHPNDFERLQPGDILITTSPDPGWTPIFDTVAGMVTERGGQLSHSAVVAREYGLPAVSGIPGLLGLLREGEMVLVDGTQGVVLRVESNA